MGLSRLRVFYRIFDFRLSIFDLLLAREALSPIDNRKSTIANPRLDRQPVPGHNDAMVTFRSQILIAQGFGGRRG